MIGARRLVAGLVVATTLALVTPAQASTPNENALASQVFAAINQARADNGVPTLSADGGLASGAQGAAEYNRTHQGEPGCEDACHTANGPAHFEIVYWGVGTTANAQSAINTWMNSPQHRANMLSPGATAGGVGVAINPDSQRTWIITWFNGGDTLPASNAPKTTTTKKAATVTTVTTAGTKLAAPPTLAATSTTPSTVVTSTTTTSISEPRRASTLRIAKAGDDDGGGSSKTGLLIALTFAVLAGAGSTLAAVRRSRRDRSALR